MDLEALGDAFTHSWRVAETSDLGPSGDNPLAQDNMCASPGARESARRHCMPAIAITAAFTDAALDWSLRLRAKAQSP
jgi:hypothetical protein